MITTDNLIYYSVNSELAFTINESYYGEHFVWCSPTFNSEKLDHLNPFRKIPPSSNPCTIHNRLKEDILRNDLHSSNIIQNKSGLKKGAIRKLADGVINSEDFARINSMIDSATLVEFSPLVYLIPKNAIEAKLVLVPVEKAANPLSIEYQIHNLKRSEFEVIQF